MRKQERDWWYFLHESVKEPAGEQEQELLELIRTRKIQRVGLQADGQSERGFRWIMNRN